MNNDYKIMQLINHSIYVITNAFDKILITPCSLGHSASHENNNHVVLCHKWLPQTGNGDRLRAMSLGWEGQPAALEQRVLLGSNLDTLGALGCYRDTPSMSAQGLSHPTPSLPSRIIDWKSCGMPSGLWYACQSLQHQ